MTAAEWAALPLLGYVACGHWWVPSPPGPRPLYPGQVVLGCPRCGQWWPLETN